MITDNTLPAVPLSAHDEHRWTMLAHLSGLLSFIGPLIVWLVYRDRSDAVERESKEALNAQITLAAVALGLYLLGAVLTLVLVGFVFLLAAAIVQLVALIVAIVGAVRAGSAGRYRYPFAYRIVT